MSRQAASINAFLAGYFILLAVATSAAYSGVFESEVLRWDDNVYLNSELVQSLSMDNFFAIFYEKHHSNWHPLTTLSFAIENALWGRNAVYSKFTNIFLHLVNVWLFYVLCHRLLLLATQNSAEAGKPGLISQLLADRKRFAIYSSLLAATLFALHPQHVESVVWISERKGLLCAVFYLAALIAYLKAQTEQTKYCSNLALIFCLFALMSKPVAVSLPVALILLDIYPLGKIGSLSFSADSITRLLRGKLSYILMALASVVITLLYQDPQDSEVFEYLPRLINACAAYLHYVITLFYPFDLSPFYPFLEFSLKPSLVSILPVLAFFSLAFIAVTFYYRGIRFPLAIFAFYVISLLPVIGIVKVGRQAMADRYAYLSTIWFYLLLGVTVYALYVLLKRYRQQYIGALLFVSISALLGFTTYDQTRHWRNDVLLWERVIDIYPDSASIAYVNLASAHDAKGSMDAEQIEQLLNKALSISPNEPYNLGAIANFYGRLGNEQKALEYLLRLVDIAPYNSWAQAQIGDIYFKRNDIANAGNYYLTALKHGSESEKVIFRLAVIDYHYQRYADALSKLEILTPAKTGAKEKALRKKIENALANPTR